MAQPSSPTAAAHPVTSLPSPALHLQPLPAYSFCSFLVWTLQEFSAGNFTVRCLPIRLVLKEMN